MEEFEGYEDPGGNIRVLFVFDHEDYSYESPAFEFKPKFKKKQKADVFVKSSSKLF